jgi:uncharacterized protein (DUF1919 family)
MRIGIEKTDYFEMIENLDYYMTQSPKNTPKSKYQDINWHGWEGRTDFPRLWYDDILIHGFHYHSQEEFFEIWEKRRKRYNSDCKFIIKILYDDEDVERFEQINWPYKLGFYHKETRFEDIISIYPEKLCDRYAYQYASYVYNMVRDGELFKKVDIISSLIKGI